MRAFLWVAALLAGTAAAPALDPPAPPPAGSAILRVADAGPVPGPVAWTLRAPGFETAEMSLTRDGREVDSVLLARVDPARWAFSVYSRPAADRNLDDWTKALGAALVINGSYYDPRGLPDTPIRSAGVDLGPAGYTGRHGAFVATQNGAGIVDLAGTNWRTAFGGAHDAMVSYPLLIDASGATRAPVSDRLANRSFVAQDRAGRIVLGTTRANSLRLSDLAQALLASQLDLRLALNLDGGPLACQGVELAGFRRRVCPPPPGQGGGDYGRTPLPVVLAVTARQ